MTLLLLALATGCATMIGGQLALSLKDRLHLILGFSAGAVIGVAFFDLLPEAIHLAESTYDVSSILTVTVIGFGLYLILDRFFLLHAHEHEGHALRAGSGAASLSLHSFLDGLAIGLAYQVSPALGLGVAAAVLAHDFSDGINTVSLVLKNGGTRSQAFKWLIGDALAPSIGIVASLFFRVPEATLGMLLALFGGFFLYIGASDLIPESFHEHPMRWTTVSTILGILALYFVIHFAGV